MCLNNCRYLSDAGPRPPSNVRAFQRGRSLQQLWNLPLKALVRSGGEIPTATATIPRDTSQSTRPPNRSCTSRAYRFSLRGSTPCSAQLFEEASSARRSPGTVSPAEADFCPRVR